VRCTVARSPAKRCTFARPSSQRCYETTALFPMGGVLAAWRDVGGVTLDKLCRLGCGTSGPHLVFTGQPGDVAGPTIAVRVTVQDSTVSRRATYGP